MTVVADPWGSTSIGQPVTRVVLQNDRLRAVLVSYGARLVELHAPDAGGRMADVVLGHDRIEAYERDHGYLGATCGRYGNRIRRGRFAIDGVEYRVDPNEPPNHLHGGGQGFDRRVWAVDVGRDSDSVEFSVDSPDGDQGYPGRLRARTTYRLDGPALRVVMTAETDAATIVNLVHHTYWNLAGHGSGSALDHRLRIPAEAYTPVDEELLPTGELRSVAGTAHDFRELRPIGDRELYDHNWVLDGAESATAGSLHRAAMLVDGRSGRTLTIDTTEPGLQFYAGAGLAAEPAGKGGAVYGPGAGVALETQRWPDSPNFEHFPECVLRPGETYRHELAIRFSSDGGA